MTVEPKVNVLELKKGKTVRKYREIKLVKPKVDFWDARDFADMPRKRSIPTESELLSLKIADLVELWIADEPIWFSLIERTGVIKRSVKFKRKGDKRWITALSEPTKTSVKCMLGTENKSPCKSVFTVKLSEIDYSKVRSDEYCLRGMVIVDPKNTNVHGLVAFDECEFQMHHIFSIYG